MRARVLVNLKRSVIDPQGKAVRGALNTLGYTQVQDVRQGKSFEIDLEGSDAASCQQEVDAMCQKLLVNPVIEEYKIEWLDTP
jgi:phosphoribosylformylglycinamidine synthase subunit PurS